MRGPPQLVQLVAERISRPFASGTGARLACVELASPRLSRECRLPPSHLSSHGRITASPFPVLLEVETLLVPRARMPGVDLRIGGMLLYAVFRPFQGVVPLMRTIDSSRGSLPTSSGVMRSRSITL